MKRLLTLLFLLPMIAFGQGTSIRSQNGLGTNISIYGFFNFKSGNDTNFSITALLTSAVFSSGGVAVGGVGNLGGGTGYAWTFPTNVVQLGGSITGNGRGLTNITEAGIAVVTNTWGNAVVNFSLGTMVATNMVGDLTITGITGFNPTNLNWQTAFLSPGAAVRAVAVPADWWVSGFTNATTVSIPSSNTAILSVRCQVGIFTNASIELFQ